MKTAIQFLLIILLPLLGTAQTWTKSFPKQVNLIKMTEAGVAIVGTDDALYGIDKEGNILWQNEKLRKVEENRVEVLSGSELIFVSDKGLLARNRVINVLTGKEYADSEVKGANVFGCYVVHGANQIHVNTGQNIEAWDINTNQKLYELAHNAPYGISTSKSASLTVTFAANQPIVYTSSTSGIMHLGLGQLSEFDFQTGKAKWSFDFSPYKLRKPSKDKSDLPSMPHTGFGVMKMDPASKTLYFPFRDMLIAVDATSGQAKWDPKANRIGKVRDLYVTDQGVLVLTLAGLQLIDAKSGAAKWKKPLKVKGADEALILQEGNDFYTVSKKYLVKVDVAQGKSTDLTDKIKFEGGEVFSKMQILGDQIVLSGQQNVVGIDKSNGKILYQHYFKAPGSSLLTITQNIALAAVAAAATANSQRIGQQNANALGRYQYYSYTPAVMESGGSATSQSSNYMYISTKFKDTDAKGFGLARVDKESGKLMDKIVVGDRDPVYATDEEAGLVYFKSDKSEIACKAVE
ncbi:MAG: PQQ-binding-like beta-propeller repeat protein [Bacteroidota bacterium]